ALGDMGSYSFDTIFRVLKLDAPVSVEASSTERFPETYPAASIIRYQFAARGEMPAVKFTWYDGGLKPPRPEELEAQRGFRGGGGSGRGGGVGGRRGRRGRRPAVCGRPREDSLRIQWRASKIDSGSADEELSATAKNSAQVTRK